MEDRVSDFATPGCQQCGDVGCDDGEACGDRRRVARWVLEEGLVPPPPHAPMWVRLGGKERARRMIEKMMAVLTATDTDA